MNRTRLTKIVFNAVYSVGSVITLYLVIISLFGSNESIYPNAMIPFTWRDRAFVFLAFGTIPMLLACMAVYKFNDVKNKKHKKRSFVFIFLPVFICAACALFIIGMFLLGFINSMFHLW